MGVLLANSSLRAGTAEDVVCTGERTADERNAELRAEAVSLDDAE